MTMRKAPKIFFGAFYGYIRSQTARAICAMRMMGIPQTKYQCLVLWWKMRMPKIDPTLPPRRAKRNSVFSGMRRAFSFFALSLSMPIRRKDKKLIANR